MWAPLGWCSHLWQAVASFCFIARSCKLLLLPLKHCYFKSLVVLNWIQTSFFNLLFEVLDALPLPVVLCCNSPMANGTWDQRDQSQIQRCFTLLRVSLALLGVLPTWLKFWVLGWVFYPASHIYCCHISVVTFTNRILSSSVGLLMILEQVWLWLPAAPLWSPSSTLWAASA